MTEVSVFIPCLADLFLPEIGEACLKLLRRLDIDPIYHKEQTCCGQPMLNAGYIKQAKRAAKHFIEVFEDDDVVVCPSGSCIHTVKHRYPDLLQDEPEWLDRAEKLASRVFELTQYIVDGLGVEDVGGSFEGKVAYHESCQLLRGLGVSEQPKKLIGGVKGAELEPLNRAEACCGFGGEFASNYSEISEAMVSDKVENYIASGADVLLACEPGCLLNIGGYLSRNYPEKKVMHIACFLAEAIQDR